MLNYYALYINYSLQSLFNMFSQQFYTTVAVYFTAYIFITQNSGLDNYLSKKFCFSSNFPSRPNAPSFLFSSHFIHSFFNLYLHFQSLILNISFCVSPAISTPLTPFNTDLSIAAILSTATLKSNGDSVSNRLFSFKFTSCR